MDRLDEWDELGRTPLLYAVYRGNLEDVKSILDQGADPNRPSRAGGTPLWHAEDDFGLTEVAAPAASIRSIRK